MLIGTLMFWKTCRHHWCIRASYIKGYKNEKCTIGYDVWTCCKCGKESERVKASKSSWNGW